MMFTATIPIGPSVNGMYLAAHRNSKFGKTLSPEFKAWTRLVGPMLMEQWRQQDQPIVGKPWALHLTLGLNNRSDLGNREKAITDMLVKVIPDWPDDRWMNQLWIQRGGEIGEAVIEAFSLPTS